MKLSMSRELICREPYRTDCYTVESPRRIITVVDDDENILDLLPMVALRYRINEAEDLLEFLKASWPDYEEDIYYNQGTPIYPIFQPPFKIVNVDIKPYTQDITTYRYKQAGEYVYGITNKWADVLEKKKAIEAPMDGWERWLKDRKQILQDKWTADHEGNLDF